MIIMSNIMHDFIAITQITKKPDLLAQKQKADLKSAPHIYFKVFFHFKGAKFLLPRVIFQYTEPEL